MKREREREHVRKTSDTNIQLHRVFTFSVLKEMNDQIRVEKISCE